MYGVLFPYLPFGHVWSTVPISTIRSCVEYCSHIYHSAMCGVLFPYLPFGHVWSTVPISTIRSCVEYCSHIWGDAPRSYEIDLLDRVQKRVVSLVGSGLSADLQALSHSTMGNVPLSLRISYLSNVLLLEALAFLNKCIVIQLILLRTGLSFINQAFSLWNSLTNEYFPPDYDLTAFKGRVNNFLLLK